MEKKKDRIDKVNNLLNAKNDYTNRQVYKIPIEVINFIKNNTEMSFSGFALEAIKEKILKYKEDV